MKPSVSPAKSALEELAVLRHLFRATLEACAAAWEARLAAVEAALEAEARKRKQEPARLRDARDMVSLVRLLKVKPEKGRRRDLKKMEAVLEDLEALVENWRE